jgi:cobalt-zinc-cadmium efflux system protein
MDHQHPQGGAHRHDVMDRRLLWSALLNTAITAAEVVGGVLSGSLALLADALHNLSDVVALVLALVARRLGRRPPSASHTYGLKRVEVLSALLNAIVLLVITAFIAREALVRLMKPAPVRSGLMLAVALVALAANLVSVFLLRSHEREDLNVKSAFLHLLQDALASLAVVLAALFAGTAVGPYLDPVASLVVGFAVLRSALSIVMESVGMLVEAVPRGLDLRELVASTDAAFSPARLHHVHVWEVGPGQRVLTAHLSVPDMSLKACEGLLGRVREFLHDRWAIQHATLEAELNGCSQLERCGAPVGDGLPPTGYKT